MPTLISDIVEHRKTMLRETLRDTPTRVVVAIDIAVLQHALVQSDADITTPAGAEAIISRLQLNSRELSSLSAKDAPKLERLGRRKIDNVLVAKSSTPFRSTCWVRAGYSGYRSAYKSFIKKIYGNVDWAGFDQMEIDHLMSQGQKRSKSKFIRIEAIDKSVNRSHGATVEKKQAMQVLRKSKDKHILSILAVLKLYNLKPPRRRSDGERFDEIKKRLKADNWEPQRVEEGIKRLLRLYERDLS